jgi:hypothetical protein
VTWRGALNAFGEEGERWVAQQIRERGLTVEWIGGRTEYDLLIEGCAKGEVKSAFLSADSRGRGNGRWQFSLRRNGILVDEHVLFLVCYRDLETDPLAVFVIPGEALDAELSKIDITSADPWDYSGQWAPYRDNWGVVDQIVARLPARKPKLIRARAEDGEIPF